MYVCNYVCSHRRLLKLVSTQSQVQYKASETGSLHPVREEGLPRRAVPQLDAFLQRGAVGIRRASELQTSLTRILKVNTSHILNNYYNNE